MAEGGSGARVLRAVAGLRWKCADYLEKTKAEYYNYHGWDKETGLQTRRKLEELDMKDVAEALGRGDALVQMGSTLVQVPWQGIGARR